MNKQLIRAALGWGFILWLIGYVLGIIFFAFLPPSILGWVIMPIGALITVWVLLNKIPNAALGDYIVLGIIWTLIAIAFDYLFLVMVFKPADGYYKADVYVYYALTMILLPIVGWYKARRRMPLH